MSERTMHVNCVIRIGLLLISSASSRFANSTPATVTELSVTPATVHGNDTITVTCAIQGEPAPSYSIYNNYTKAVLASGVTVGTVTKVKVAQCQDATVWVCTATNDPGSGVNSTRAVNATVYCAPRPRGSNLFRLQEDLGLVADLSMSYAAYPAPTVTWERDGETFTTPNHVYSAPAGATILQVSHVTVADFLSNYTLNLTNDVGTYIAEYQIVPTGPPETPSQLRAHNVTQSSVTLTWVSGYDMGSRQHFILMVLTSSGSYIQMSEDIYLEYADHGINQTCTYTQRGLASDTQYHMAVTAENEKFMDVRMTKPVAFRTLVGPSTTVIATVVTPSTSGSTESSAAMATPFPLWAAPLLAVICCIG